LLLPESGFPVESLFALPIMVERPMSCIVNEVPAPTLARLDSSLENVLHSAPVSSNFSLITNPQYVQNNSPEVSSVTIFLFPHEGHFCLVRIGLFNNTINPSIKQVFYLLPFYTQSYGDWCVG